MIESLLDGPYRALHGSHVQGERSVIVMGAMEAALTPLMEAIEAQFAGIKVFSLPSVDHPTYGRHIELGVKGRPDGTAPAYAALLAGLREFGAQLGPEMVR
jgi:molybdopterin-biosynthesis enzyme MoeA-like protein